MFGILYFSFFFFQFTLLSRECNLKTPRVQEFLSYLHLLLLMIIAILDFVIHAKDSIQDSRMEDTLPVVGNVIDFLDFVFPEFKVSRSNRFGDD